MSEESRVMVTYHVIPVCCQDEAGPTEEDASESSRRRLEELDTAEQADLTERLKAAEEHNKALKLQSISVQQGLRPVGP